MTKQRFFCQLPKAARRPDHGMNSHTDQASNRCPSSIEYARLGLCFASSK
eukprot:CAMPEP_0204469500 /NCGR_PEP_ID=MMETSP0471-20130131/14610_1 /ASSEMBLY_ACC=CAM_ASM_000602 /TAXON_ID=2969 /ORGANISM="Oxyrrhis marina" /LENGTH=49 /DNA_ID= /DNA_START= /DNA_END= /DNA_ORIENTATION=